MRSAVIAGTAAAVFAAVFASADARRCAASPSACGHRSRILLALPNAHTPTSHQHAAW